MSDEIWTIQRILLWTRDYLQKAGSPSPRLDAELLLADVLKLRRLDLLLRFEQPLQKDELTTFKRLIQRRAKHEPVAYILGRKAFYGIDLCVDRRVLVPRPETESLVDEVLSFLAASGAPAGPLLDLCTGSGAIALALADALAKKDARREVVATDVSADALAVARTNGDRLGLGDVSFAAGDLFAAVGGRTFAVIASNPPYVTRERMAQLDADVRDFEPHLALDGGKAGFEILARIAADAPRHLMAGGLLIVELGSKAQGLDLVAALDQSGMPGGRVIPVMGGPTSLVLATRA